MIRTIDVKQLDIDTGLKGDCALCPIARALDRATGESWRVHSSWATRSGDSFKTHLPLEAVRFIDLFDEGRPVKPFSFDLEITNA